MRTIINNANRQDCEIIINDWQLSLPEKKEELELVIANIGIPVRSVKLLNCMFFNYNTDYLF